MTNRPPTILGLDPGTRFLGMAVVRDGDLLDYAVHELRNGEEPHDLLMQARRVIFRCIAQHNPDVVAIEAPYLIATKRGATLTVLAQELNSRSKEFGLAVHELSPETVRQTVVGRARATKYEVAQVLGARFAPLRGLVPRKPKNPTLWLTSKERYWLHVFDALALAVAVGPEGIHRIPGEAGAPAPYAGGSSGPTLLNS